MLESVSKVSTMKIPVPTYIKRWLEYKLSIDLEKGYLRVKPHSCWFSKVFVMTSSLEGKTFNYDYNSKEVNDFMFCSYPDEFPFPHKDYHFKYLNSYFHHMFDEELFLFVDSICIRDKILEEFSLNTFNALIKYRSVNYKQLEEAKKSFSNYVKETYKKQAVLLFMRKVGLDDNDISFETLIKRVSRNVTDKGAKGIKELRSTLFNGELSEDNKELETIWDRL